jgi:hypothetical protein
MCKSLFPQHAHIFKEMILFFASQSPSFFVWRTRHPILICRGRERCSRAEVYWPQQDLGTSEDEIPRRSNQLLAPRTKKEQVSGSEEMARCELSAFPGCNDRGKWGEWLYRAVQQSHALANHFENGPSMTEHYKVKTCGKRQPHGMAVFAHQ